MTGRSGCFLVTVALLAGVYSCENGDEGTGLVNASDISLGTLSPDHFSAYADLVAEEKIGTNADQLAGGDHAHTGVYATSTHNHDGEYLSTEHDHDTEYSSLSHDHEGEYLSAEHDHDTEYSSISHNHDGAYPTMDHNHDTSYATSTHNHDAAYSSSTHNHDADYAGSAHDHEGVYASDSHNHDSVYATASHGHSEFIVGTGDTLTLSSNLSVQVNSSEAFRIDASDGTVRWKRAAGVTQIYSSNTEIGGSIGNSAFTDACCEAMSDIPITGGCMSSSAVSLYKSYPLDWDNASTAACYQCGGVRRVTGGDVSLQATIVCKPGL